MSILSEQNYSRVKNIAEHYGLDHQMVKTAEELSELLDVISQDKIMIDDLANEMADVLIMIHQLIFLTDSESETKGMINHKIDRQLSRMEDGNS